MRAFAGSGAVGRIVAEHCAHCVGCRHRSPDSGLCCWSVSCHCLLHPELWFVGLDRQQQGVPHVAVSQDAEVFAVSRERRSADQGSHDNFARAVGIQLVTWLCATCGLYFRRLNEANEDAGTKYPFALLFLKQSGSWSSTGGN